MSDQLEKDIEESIANLDYQQNQEHHETEQDKDKEHQDVEKQSSEEETKGIEHVTDSNTDDIGVTKLQDTEEVIENSPVDPQLKEQQESTTKMLLSERDLVDEIDELFTNSTKTVTENNQPSETNKRAYESLETPQELTPNDKRQKLDANTETSVPTELESVNNHNEQLQPIEPTQERQPSTTETTYSISVPVSTTNEVERASSLINEQEDLEMIAKQYQQATNLEIERAMEGHGDGGQHFSTQENGQPSGSLLISSIVPSDSELLNTNQAYAAYTSLSSQLEQHTLASAMLSSATLSALPLSIIAPVYLPPRIQLLINTLPTLDNLATQLLRTVATSPYQKIIDLASNPDTSAGATYRDLTSLFEFTKRLYSEDDPFLTVEHIAPGMWKEGEETPSIFKPKQQSIESTLRKVNLATFLAATLGTMEIGFFYLNESFLDVFCPLNNLDPLNALSNLGGYQNGLQSTDSPVGARVGKLLKPQATLYLDLKTQAYISAIEAGERSKEEILEDILPDDLHVYLMSRRNAKLLSPTETDFVWRCKQRKELLLNYTEETPLSEQYDWFTFLRDLFDYVSKNIAYLIWGKMGKTMKNRREDTPHTQELLDNTTGSTQMPNQLSSSSGQASSTPSVVDPNKMLVSEMREANIAVPKPSQRRAWSREEEKALRHALELKGPHWATILELFGQGGKISEALKNRTQVQLKDKARNWKKFFLRSGLEIPSYLRGVTGGVDDGKRKKDNVTKKTAAAPVPNMLEQLQQQQQRQQEKQEKQQQEEQQAQQLEKQLEQQQEPQQEQQQEQQQTEKQQTEQEQPDQPQEEQQQEKEQPDQQHPDQQHPDRQQQEQIQQPESLDK